MARNTKTQTQQTANTEVETLATDEVATVEDLPCRCGCKAPTKSTYAPGHDARHAGVVGRWLLANPDATKTEKKKHLDTLPTPALQAKAERVVETAKRKEAEKASKAEARAKAKAAAKAAYEAALAEA